MKSHQINYNDTPVNIDRLDRETFCVHLPERDVTIQYRADNEGADHWLDLATDHETEETKKLGEQLAPLLKDQ
jgi:hypothetical protein